MVFSSLLFTFYFLPVIAILYYISKDNYRNAILLAASIFFYAYGEPGFVFVMLIFILINYLLALLIDKYRGVGGVIYVLDVLANIGLLVVFKYLGFICSQINLMFKLHLPVPDIALPIGISFFTFQALSYVTDVYRGSVKVQKNPFNLALYISFFPQLIAGPIVRYAAIEKQIDRREHNIEKCGEGIRRFMLGFCKKIILANNLSNVATAIFSNAESISSANPLLLWIGSISFSLQIFYDFSGYSDMAIGLGKFFGFDFEENFNYPYVAKSVTEFWRRWHISLGNWFRDYVYIPLGGSRVPVARHLLNLFIVWLLTGIWHGANKTFIAWGIGYFLLLVLEKYLVKPYNRKAIIRIFWQVVTLLCVNFGWVIFNSGSVKSGISYCLAMLGGYGTQVALDSTVVYFLREYGFYLVLGILFSTPIMKIIADNKYFKSKELALAKTIILPIIYSIVFLWAVSFLILGAHNPFIYFNF